MKTRAQVETNYWCLDMTLKLFSAKRYTKGSAPKRSYCRGFTTRSAMHKSPDSKRKFVTLAFLSSAKLKHLTSSRGGNKALPALSSQLANTQGPHGIRGIPIPRNHRIRCDMHERQQRNHHRAFWSSLNGSFAMDPGLLGEQPVAVFLHAHELRAWGFCHEQGIIFLFSP
jgi:hypothetical protein